MNTVAVQLSRPVLRAITRTVAPVDVTCSAPTPYVLKARLED